MKKIIDKYTYRVEWSDEDDTHIARCFEFPTLIAHGPNPEEALKQIKKVVKETYLWMKEEDEEIPEPLGIRVYKGNLSLRTSPEIHRKLAMKAAEQKISINQYILSRLT
jgi:predicted HicB family RNase H-like nuclease